MSPEDLALFPFLNAASDYVDGLDVTLDALIRSKAFEPARKRGYGRLAGSLNGSLEKPSFSSDGDVLTELLSYPYARILVSCVGEPAFIRKYAFSEALAVYEMLHSDIDRHFPLVMEIAGDLGISAVTSDKGVCVHFTDYVRYAVTMKDIGWKMVNRRVSKGYAEVRKQEFVRLIQEAVRRKIESSLPLQIPGEIEMCCREFVDDLKEQFESVKKELDETEFGEVEPLFFPPCINQALAGVREGVNLAHSMRFALVAFLINVGMSVDDVVTTFNVSPDFSEEKTRYQVEHIAGNEYKCPSCATMEAYGNCPGKCEKVRHPLGYYSMKIYARNARLKEDPRRDAPFPASDPAGAPPASDMPQNPENAEKSPRTETSAD